MVRTVYIYIYVYVQIKIMSTIWESGCCASSLETTMCWVLPPLSKCWIIFMVYLYIVLNMTPNIDC